MRSKRNKGALYQGARMSATIPFWKLQQQLQQNVQCFCKQKRWDFQLIFELVFQRCQVQMQNPMHENQVHNKVIDIAIFFEGIGYKVWQNCWHNSRKIQHWWAHIFNKIGRLYRRRENFALLDPCQSIGHSSGDEKYNFTIAWWFLLQLPNDFFTIARWCFYNCQVMRRLKSSDLWTRWCCKTKRYLDNAPTTFRSEFLRTVW